jgi:acyl-CoA synthetase (AMP-forming)/AMP-acid ligase II
MPDFNPAPRTIPLMLADTVRRHADHIAIDDGERTLRYADLQREALRAAGALIAGGIEPGDRVAIWAPNCTEWIVAALGIHHAGGVLVPVNTRMKGQEACYVLQASGARLLFCVGEFLGVYYPDQLVSHLPSSLEKMVILGRARGAAVSWDAFLDSGATVDEATVQARAAEVTPDSLSDLMFTSGTTGNPKGVMTAHGQNLRAIAGWSQAMGLVPDDRYLIINPFFHCFGYKAGWLASLMHGVTILMDQVFEPGTVLQRIARDRISVLPGAPTVFHELLAHPGLKTTDLSSLRATITGSTTIPPDLIRQMRNELGFSVVLTGYGLTESCGFATLCDAADDAETVATTSGRAMSGIDLRIVDIEGNAVPAGVEGEIVLRGYNVMRGYYDDEVATREAIDAQGWLHTGDVGVLDERGYLRITDRLKDMYIVGGFNCYPAEVEKLMAQHPHVQQVAVVGMPDERLGETGHAFIVPRGGAILSQQDVIAWCRDHMANYKVPRRISFVDALPINASGKVLKRELREAAKQVPA